MTRSEMIDAVLAQCAEDKGVVEIPRGSNRGGRVEAMLGYTGLSGGFPWCVGATTAWGVEALGKAWPIPRTADCDRVLSWARARGVLHNEPERGDQFLLMRSYGDAFHTGIVSSIIDDEWLWTWEGNTNDGGSHDGHGVFYRKRRRRNLKYVRWVDAMPAEAEIKPVPAVPTSSAWKVWVSPYGYFPVVEVKDGRPCAPVRALVASILGTSLEGTEEVVGWDEDAARASVRGQILPGTYLKGGTGWAPVREIAEGLGCVVSVAGGTKTQPQRIVTVGVPHEGSILHQKAGA